MKQLIIFFYLTLFSISGSYSQSSWTYEFGDERDDIARSSFQTKDGGFLTVGEIAIPVGGIPPVVIQTYLIKFDFYGNIAWQKTYGDSVIQNGAFSAVEDDFGNFYVPFNASGATLMKINSIGNILWSKSYPDTLEGFNKIYFSEDKKYLLISGVSSNAASIYTLSLTKLDTSGNLIWSRSYYDSLHLFGGYSSSGNVLITNEAYYIPCRTFIKNNNSNGVLLKIDTSGSLLWKNDFLNTSYLHGIAKNSESSFIVSGAYQNPARVYCFKFNPDGDIIWEKVYLNDSAGTLLTKTLDNNFALAGGGRRADVDSAYKNIFIIDSLGNKIGYHHHFYDTFRYIEYNDIKVTSDSGYIISGVFYTYDSDNESSPFLDGIVIKTNSSGKIVGIIKNEVQLQQQETISANIFPNPFNPVLNIEINLIKDSDVKVILYNITGKEIQTITNTRLRMGKNLLKLNSDGLRLASGVYFLKISAGKESLLKKVVLVK